MRSSRSVLLSALAAFVAAVLCCSGPTVSADQAPGAAKEQRVDFQGYAEWRHGDDLIVDGQRVVWSPQAKFKGDQTATSPVICPSV